MDVVVVHDDELIQFLEKDLEGPPKDIIDLDSALTTDGNMQSIKQLDEDPPPIHQV
jgi:hypothetical protein